MTCSRREANEVNFLALEALFPNYSPQAKVDGDTDTNPANHNDSRDLNVDVHLEPAPLPIFIGMCVSFSRHARPGKAYVNGMHGTVESWNSATPSVRVRTDTGFLVPVWRWTDLHMNNAVFYPLRPGYAATALKWAGPELPPCTWTRETWQELPLLLSAECSMPKIF